MQSAPLQPELHKKKNASATGCGRSALSPTGELTPAPMTAVGGTLQRQTKFWMTTTGSPATSLIRGRSARRYSFLMTGLKSWMMAATANGSGRSARRCTFNPTSACGYAVGGTLKHHLTITGMTTSGSPAKSLLRGSNASFDQGVGLVRTVMPRAMRLRAVRLSGSSSRSA